MVKLDLSILRYLSRDDFRVLTAVEMGMKNHDLVSTQLINSLASLKRGDVVKAMQQLHKNKLVYHESKPCTFLASFFQFHLLLLALWL